MMFLHPVVMWPMYVFAFLTGATITSFSCLAVDRLPHQMGWVENPRANYTLIYPRSHCNACYATIPFLYLLPVIGFVLSLGQCQTCKTRIPWAYPLLELIGGLAIFLTVYYLGITLQALVITLLLLSLIFLSWMDYQQHWLPAIVTYPLLLLGLLLSPFCNDIKLQLLGAATGLILTCFAMFLVSKMKKIDAFAGGDVALITVAGAWFGIVNLPDYLFLSCLIFILYALPYRIKKIQFVPMGPALSLGFLYEILLHYR